MIDEEELRWEREEELRREAAEDEMAALMEDGREARELRRKLERAKECLAGAKEDAEVAEKVAYSTLPAILAAAQGANAAATATREQVDQLQGEVKETGQWAADAARSARRTEAEVKERVKLEALAGDMVATFREMDAALQDEGGSQLEIANGVLEEARAMGRMLGDMGPGVFLRRWRAWGARLERPNAAQYAAIHEREKRWPD